MPPAARDAKLHRAALTLCLLGLAACAHRMPKEALIPIETIVPVPDELTTPCAIYRAKAQTVGEAVKGHNLNVLSLEACNARMQQIRKLGRPLNAGP